MWCWRRMDKISCTDRVRSEEVLHRVKEERNILHTIKRGKANWIGHILRRNCLLKHVIEGKLEGRIEMTGRRGRRRKQLLDDLREKWRYWKLKEEALDRTVWRTRFGSGYRPGVRQTAGWMDTRLRHQSTCFLLRQNCVQQHSYPGISGNTTTHSHRKEQWRTRGGGLPGSMPAPPPPNRQNRHLKKYIFCRYYDIKSFVWFILQPKSATEIGWSLLR
jgi:hypothetical protein